MFPIMSRSSCLAATLTGVLLFAGAAQAEKLYALGGGQGANSPRDLYLIDPDTGAATRLGSTGVPGLNALAEHPITEVLYAAIGTVRAEETGLYTIDKHTAEATYIGGDWKFVGLSFTPSGELYGVTNPDAGDEGGELLFEIDPDTGEAWEIGWLDDHLHPQDLAWDPTGTNLYWVAEDGVYLLDPDTGEALDVVWLDDSMNTATFRSDGVLFTGDWPANGGELYVVDPDTGDSVVVGDTEISLYGLTFAADPPPPVPANGFLSPTYVRAPGAGGTMVVYSTLDLGDMTVDLAAPATIEYGAETIEIPGFTPNRRRTAWTYTSPDRRVRVNIKPPNRRRGTSRGRICMSARGWLGRLQEFPGGGDGLHLRFASGDFDVSALPELVGGIHRRHLHRAADPPLALDRIAGFLRGRDTPRVAIAATFAGDGEIPVDPPTVMLRFGAPGSLHEVEVPTVEHYTESFANGWRFKIPDPDGPGPLPPPRVWRVDVDYVMRRVQVFSRDEFFGSFGRGDVPFYFSFGLNGIEKGVQVTAQNRSRLSYR